MAPTRIEVVKHRRLASMTAEERAEFDAAHERAHLAIEVDEPEQDADDDGVFGLRIDEAD
jgi:hypothetical protein